MYQNDIYHRYPVGWFMVFNATYCVVFFSVYIATINCNNECIVKIEPHRRCIGYRARLECGRSWVHRRCIGYRARLECGRSWVHRRCIGYRARLECGRSCVRAPIGSNQRE